MFDRLLKYDFGVGVEAFSTQRDAMLPYHVIQGHQIHGCKVAVIEQPNMTREDLEGYDALVTNLPVVAIGVRTADCIPVLIYDPVKRVVAAVHAGWKGTVLHISQKVIDVMSQRFGCNPADMMAALGPGIGPDSFQVGEEVAEHFKNADFPIDEIWTFQGGGNGMPMSGGHHIDLWKANQWLLEQVGIPKENIHVAAIDTFSTTAFFSARREGIQCGRIYQCHQDGLTKWQTVFS